MNDLNSDEKGKSCCAPENSAGVCCQPHAGDVSSCCNSGEDPWKKGKWLVSLIVIVAAIGVGTNAFLKGTAQSYTTEPVKSFSAGLSQIPAVAANDGDQGKVQTKREEIALDRVLDSLQALDTVAADKDVVFLVLASDAQIAPLAIPKQVGTVANNLWNQGQKVAVYTLKNGASDHNRLVRHFSVNALPCVAVLGRQGSASAVSGDITEGRLYNAFVLASKPAACCPTQGNASCCPPQGNASCCPK